MNNKVSGLSSRFYFSLLNIHYLVGQTQATAASRQEFDEEANFQSVQDQPAVSVSWPES
jgi:hypothetical protein